MEKQDYLDEAYDRAKDDEATEKADAVNFKQAISDGLLVEEQ